MPSVGIAIVEALLNAKPETQAEAAISGYVIGRGSAHAIAIYDRNGVSWVAEFRDGRGVLMNANTWFYFHAERLGYWNRRHAYKSVKPIPVEMLQEIERLHRERDIREAATATARCKHTLAEAATRLHRALEMIAGADDRSFGREQSSPATGPLRSLNRLTSFVRDLLLKANQLPINSRPGMRLDYPGDGPPMGGASSIIADRTRQA